MKKRKKFSKVMSLLLSVIMVFTMMPAVAWADETAEAETVTVNFTAQSGGQFVMAPQSNVEVSSDLAESYGLEPDLQSGVSVLDVMVKAHEIKYGTAFKPDTLGYYLTFQDPSYFTGMFEISDGGGWGFAVNGQCPTDGIWSEDWQGYTGYAINQAEVQTGDSIELFNYSDWNCGEYICNLQVLNSGTIDTETPVNISLTGWPYMAYGFQPEDVIASNTVAMAGMQLYTVSSEGALTAIDGAVTDAEGKATFTLNEGGTYRLTAKPTSQTAGGVVVIMPLTEVAVEEQQPQNTAPTLKGEATEAATREAGSTYELDLSTIFEDADGDTLTYYAKVGDGEYIQVEGGNYSYATSTAGTYTLTFKANDGTAYSPEYVVTLTVESAGTDPTTLITGAWDSSAVINITNVTVKDVFVTEHNWNGNECTIMLNSQTTKNAAMKISITTGVTGGGPQMQQMLQQQVPTFFVKMNDVSVFSAKYGTEETTISLENGETDVIIVMSVSGKDIKKTFKFKVEKASHVHSYGDWERIDDSTHKRICTSAEGECLAPTQTAPHGWDSGVEEAVTENGVVVATKTTYTCGDCGATKVEQNASASILAITVPEGARAQIYRQDNYYKYTEYEALASSENQNDTTTYYFSANTKDGTWSYRVTKAGHLTKVGYIAWGAATMNVTHSSNDILPSARVDYTTAGTENVTVAEDGVLLNVNRQNFLTMDAGSTKTLKAYRTWELVQSYLNCVITPDFHYTIISGNDVVSLTDKASPSAGDGDWKTLTALKEGTAIIEVTYDAIQLDGGDYDGVYGATDPARTGLIVVQVGGKVADVDFGIKGKSSQSKSTSAMTYSQSYAKPWDAEFDTLYFTGTSRALEFSPTVSNGTISKVEISADKGNTWTQLTSADGTYTADIVPGNNIIKVTADTGVSYQIVRGDKISVTYQEKTDASTNPADGDGIIEAGETIRITFNGLHQPIPKISGNYNPGYPSNDGGDMKIRLKYTFNNSAIQTENPMWQYNFITAGNHIDLVIPEGDATSYTLRDGYISVGVLGLPAFADDDTDSHRNIPDEGCNTRGGKGEPTYNTRSMLPDLTITVGRATDANTPPVVKGSALKNKTIELGENFVINPETLFDDADGNTLSFKVSINGEEPEDTDAAFKFTPAAVGTYTVKFTASDGKDEAEHTITLTVTNAKQEGGKNDFGLLPSEIAGYVRISFEDNAERKTGETGLKFPVALGTIIPVTEVPYKAGETIADVTLRLLDYCGIGYKTSQGQYGFYLSAIKNFKVDNTKYEEMGEFSAGNGSGWMITHNKVFIGQSAGNVIVKNNDRIEWKFTCQLGADIGDPYFAKDKKEEVKDVTTNNDTAGAAGEPVTTTTPTEVKVSGATATATIKKEHVTETIKQATEHKAEEIVVQVTETDTKGAANVRVQIDTTTVKDIVDKTDAALTVKTDDAAVTLDRETLKTVVSETAGSTVTLDVIKVSKPTEGHKAAAGENGHIIQLVLKSGSKIISVFKEGKATVTVAIPTRLDGKKVAAIHIGDDGKVEHLKGKEVTVNGKKQYRFETPHFSTFALVDADEIGLVVEEEEKMTKQEVKALIADLSLVARSVKTTKKNIKVTLKLDSADKAVIEQLEDAGYTVKYNFYRSTKKSSKYSSKVVKKGTSYTNTSGKKNAKYYYKVRLQVYNAEGKLVARTELKQCRYASRVWTK